MLAQVAGHRLGVAKKVKPVVARMFEDNGSSFINLVDAVIGRESTPENQDALAVFSYSGNFPRYNPYDGTAFFESPDGTDQWSQVVELIHNAASLLVNANVMLVSSSGNEGAVCLQRPVNACRERIGFANTSAVCLEKRRR